MKLHIILTCALTSVATVALSHGGATGIVKQRMDAMVDLAQTLKSLSVAAKSDASLDPALLEQASESLRQHSGENLTELFPEDSKSKHSEAQRNNLDRLARICGIG